MTSLYTAKKYKNSFTTWHRRLQYISKQNVKEGPTTEVKPRRNTLKMQGESILEHRVLRSGNAR
jgi:hypothetical protein